MTFLAVESMSDESNTVSWSTQNNCLPFDGVIGLAPYGYAALVDYLFNTDQIEENTVTLNINYWPGYHDQLEDAIIFGGLPETLAALTSHTFDFCRVVDEHKWALNLDEVRFGSYKQKLEN